MELLNISNFSGKNGTQFELNLYYEVLSQDIANNKSTIRYYLYWKSPGGYSGSGSTVTGYINGSSVGTATSISAGENKLMGTKDVTITHGSNGKFPNTSYSAKIDTPWTLGDASVSGTLTSSNVATIPRKSSVSGGSGNIGSNTTITITRANSSFTHDLYWTFGDLTGLIAKGVGTSCTWTIPTSLFAQIPNSNSGTGTITCKTYLDSDYVGESTCSFTAKVVDSNPIFSSSNVSYLDSDSTITEITGNNQHIVRNLSNLEVTFTDAIAQNSASISKYEITLNGGTKTKTSATTIDYGKLNVSSDIVVSIKVTDSRGNSTTAKKTISILDWVLPSASILLSRLNNYEDETHLKVTGKISSVNSKNDIESIIYRFKKVSESDYSDDISLNNDEEISISKDKLSAWNFQIVISDKFGTTTYNLILPKGQPILFIDTKKLSVGINGFPINDNTLEVNGNLLVETSDKGNVLHTGVDAYLPDGYCGLDMHNSDIVHANGIYMNDELSGREGIAFLKQGGDKDNADDFEFLQGRRGVLYYDDDAVLDAGNYLDYTHPVGSVIITSTNTNPSGTLGGTWELYNRHMSGLNVSESNENSIFTPVSSVISDYTVTIIRTETSLRIRLAVTTASALTDSNITLGTFDFTKVGVTSLYYTMEQLPMMFDGGNSVVNVTLGYTGTLTSKDVITRGSDSASLAVGSTGYLNVDVSIPSTNRGLNACGEFHWKRTA